MYDLFRDRLSDPNIDEKERVRIARIIEIHEGATSQMQVENQRER